MWNGVEDEERFESVYHGMSEKESMHPHNSNDRENIDLNF
jgi:hypothetical protein